MVKGNNLSDKGKKDLALKIFKLNVHSFPKAPNVYDSLGEAYEGRNQHKLALTNYTKAVNAAKKSSHPMLSLFEETLERFKKKMN